MRWYLQASSSTCNNQSDLIDVSGVFKAGSKPFHRWWKLWQGYTDYDDTASTIEDLDPLSGYFPTTMTPIQRARPPAIDNFDLVATTSKDSAPELKDGLAEESDYMLLPEEAWKKLHGW